MGRKPKYCVFHSIEGSGNQKRGGILCGIDVGTGDIVLPSSGPDFLVNTILLYMLGLPDDPKDITIADIVQYDKETRGFHYASQPGNYN